MAARLSSRPASAAVAHCRCIWDVPNRAANLRQQHCSARAQSSIGLDAVIVNASGCGTTVKDYGHLVGSENARRFAALTKDITEFLAALDLPKGAAKPYRVAYHDACSLQHGQRDNERTASVAVAWWLQSHRGAGEAFLLRLCRHLQSATAGNRGGAWRTQGRAISGASIPILSPRAISAAWCRSAATPICLLCIPSSYWTGRPADRRRRLYCAASCVNPSMNRAPPRLISQHRHRQSIQTLPESGDACRCLRESFC